MNLKLNHGKIAIALGGLTLILFSTKPFILDFIEPSKSIGQIIGENAKDLVESINGQGKFETSNSKRDIWSNILIILSFILFVITLIFSISSVQKKGEKKWLGIVGVILSVTGLGIYFAQLTLGLLGLIVVAILVVVTVTIGEV